MKKQGQLITIEGIEGVGKTTNLALIQKILKAKNIPFITTREPGGTPIAESIRNTLLTQHDETLLPMSELLLLFAARAQHIATVIMPALNAGQWVVCDRFTDASYAYQGAGRNIDTNKIATLEQWIQPDLQPDLTLLLDAPVSVALARAKKRSKPDRFEAEQHSFFERVRNNYLERAQKNSTRFRIIAADKPLDEVAQAVQTELDAFIADRT